MSKLSVEDLAEVLRASQRMHGHPEERVDQLIQAVRAEAEERVWCFMERVMEAHAKRCGVELVKTAREAILAAAKELGIDTEVQS